MLRSFNFYERKCSYLQIAKSESSHLQGCIPCMAGIEYMRTDFDDALANIKTAYNLCKNESEQFFLKLLVLTILFKYYVFGRGDISRSVKRCSLDADRYYKTK